MIYRVTVNGRTYDVEIDDLNTRPILARIDGETFEVMPETTAAANPGPAPSAAPAASAAPVPARATPSAPTPAASAGRIDAPIPGVIVELHVKPGDTVTARQPVAVLEAMKMKNIIRAPRDGQIKTVYAAVGQQVKHHDPIMDYAD